MLSLRSAHSLSRYVLLYARSAGYRYPHLLVSQIQASPQCKEAFQQTQRQFDIEKPLVIPLHTATRWGSALKMLKRSHHLNEVLYALSLDCHWSLTSCRQPITSFTATADAKFGPITTIRQNGKVTKKIPWSAFRLEKEDWDRVKLCVEILEVRVISYG